MMLIGLAGPPGAGKRTIGVHLMLHYGFVRTFRRVPSAFFRERNASSIVVLDLVEDCEADYLRNAGGQVWLVQRPGYLTRAGDAYHGIMVHSSDRGLLNDGPVAALYNRVDKLLDDLQDQART
jgi:hypothetical protein